MVPGEQCVGTVCSRYLRGTSSQVKSIYLYSTFKSKHKLTQSALKALLGGFKPMTYEATNAPQRILLRCWQGDFTNILMLSWASWHLLHIHSMRWSGKCPQRRRGMGLQGTRWSDRCPARKKGRERCPQIYKRSGRYPARRTEKGRCLRHRRWTER